MLPKTLATIISLTAVAILSCPSAAALHTAGYSVEVLVDGRPLNELHGRGTTYVEAAKGAEYAVRLTNHTGARIAVALAVDGLNSIDARTTTAAKAAKWVLGPYETITVDGWQTSTDTARRFFFTTEDQSYGAWLGRTDHLGVVEAVVYRERRPRPLPAPWTEGAQQGGSRRNKSAPSARSQAAPRSEADAGAVGESLSDEMAATGIGREVDNPVRRVEFRAEAEPAARIRIRYEYRDQLVRLGLLPDPDELCALDRREQAHGFTDGGFAPDPYRGRRP